MMPRIGGWGLEKAVLIHYEKKGIEGWENRN
jgi:hypothetical protein